MSTIGAAEAASAAGFIEPSSRAREAQSSRGPSCDDFFLPDFCAARMVLAVVLLAVLLSLTLALARSPAGAFLTELARISLFVQWLSLTSAALLCYQRVWLKRLSVLWASAAVFALLLANTAILSELAFWLGRRFAAQGLVSPLFPQEHGPFLLSNAVICLIVTALLLRYFFVTHQWRRHVRAEARSRIHALQARIRPHFLFNSMNTIASLTRSDPARAEEAVEDLADLFRATLKDSERPLTLKEELELTRIYQRIEMLRLGERLEVKWDVANLPMRALIPALSIQPLLENAIYHGIEPLDGGGCVAITGHVEDGRVVISVSNPVAAAAEPREHGGNRLALDNIRDRLELAYGDRGEVEIRSSEQGFEVIMRFPLQQ